MEEIQKYVENVKKSLTEEERKYYEDIGNYMYNDEKLYTKNSLEKPKKEDIVDYASRFLKSGGDPNDLTDGEIIALNRTYGEQWFNNFGIKKNQIRTVKDLSININPIKDENNIKHSRQYSRFLKRKQKK
jgi:hypothetical protein